MELCDSCDSCDFMIRLESRLSRESLVAPLAGKWSCSGSVPEISYPVILIVCFLLEINLDRIRGSGYCTPVALDHRSRRRMVRGSLEVLLVGAKGLEDTDVFGAMDPYAILTCRTQEQRSSTATGKGSEPEWNETFVFNVSDDVPEVVIKLMDSDALSNDDFVGEAKISLEPLFLEGRIPPTVYNVVKDEEYRGEIKIGLTFIPEEDNRGYGEENYRGWRGSS